MSAQSLEVVTLIVPNPEWHPNERQFTRVNQSLGYYFLTSFNIRTLSSRGANRGNDVTGLLYVPDLAETDPCVNASAPYVPQNVVRRVNLPPEDYNLVALAPWVSGECSLQYMQAARQDPVRSIVFFVPGNTTGTPPDAHDPQWDIANAGDWRLQNGFPVYAISGQSGAMLMAAAGNYSGNMTDVPFGNILDQYYDPKDYVRLEVDIDTGNGSSLPSLWVFLLIVLGILLALIGATSLAMHCLQRRRRQSLRRRVRSGEVDLEALGIKRLTVPRDMLNSMPLYAYGTPTPAAPRVLSPSSDGSTDLEKIEGTTPAEFVNGLSRPASEPRCLSYRPSPLSQPCCAICLDDFVPATADEEGTMVRELPCHHIFHPECVDTFLRDSSSLCPMCKKTALPAGFCPPVVTNAMVRRERALRRMRERMARDPEAMDSMFLRNFNRRLRNMPGVRQYRATTGMSSAPVTASQQMTQLDADVAPGTGSSQVPLTPGAAAIRSPVQPPATAEHRSWARQRAENMLGRRAPDDSDEEEASATPAWRKAVRGLFPRR